MKQIAKLFLSAFTISFLGSLPLGTLNITITNISIQQDYFSTLNFAIGAILVEIIIVKLSFTAIIQLEKIKPLLKLFNWLSIIILFTFSIVFLASAIQKIPQDESIPIKMKNAILWGALLSFLNPLHLPFWMVWSSILKSKGILINQLLNQFIYFLAIALGTGLAYYLYIKMGGVLIQFFKDQIYLINWIIGVSFLFTGVIQLLKLKKKIFT